MSRKFLFVTALLGCVSLAAMEWPLPEAVVVRNFGYNDRGRPALGVMFEGDRLVHAAEKGELIFSSSGKDTASRLPSPLGAWAAVDHGDGLVSVYGRYKDEGRKPQPPVVYQGFPIAAAGNSGWSDRDGLYFLLYDRRESRWVNPSMVINPFQDNVPPQISGIQLRRADGRVLEGTGLRSISQGRYSIAVNAIDIIQVQRGLQLAPHRIICSVNGEEAGQLSFETICARDGVLMVNRNGLVPALRVYGTYPAFEVGEVQLTRGQALLEIVVQDVVGNSRRSLIRMLVE